MLMLRYEIAMGASKKAKRVDGIAGAHVHAGAHSQIVAFYSNPQGRREWAGGGQRALFRCMKDKVHEPLQSR